MLDEHLNNELSFETFQMILENDKIFNVNGTVFYFDDDSEDDRSYSICCDHHYNKPYWITQWDDPISDKYLTASELLAACVFNGKSFKDRYENVIIEEIDGVSLKYFAVAYYKEIGKMLSEHKHKGTLL